MGQTREAFHVSYSDAEEALEEINKKTGRNMVQATATGIMLIVVIVGSLVWRTDLFMALIVVVTALAVWELRVDFAAVNFRIPFFALSISTSLTFLAGYYCEQHAAAMVIGTLCSAVWVVIASSFQFEEKARVSKAVQIKPTCDSPTIKAKESGADRLLADRVAHVGVSLMVVGYITVLSCFIILPLTWGHPVAHAFMSIFIPAAGDLGGLFFGAMFGKHKLSSRISPKKSYEGLLGSAFFCAVAALCIGFFTYSHEFFAQKWPLLILMGTAVSVTGTFGDLCASMLKRDIGIKDMGHLLKGHGGIVDRVDSILISAPFVCAIIAVTGM